MVVTSVMVESTLKYHSGRSGYLTSVRDPDQGQCLVGSLTGALLSLKGNGGAQRFPQPGWQSGVECKCTRSLTVRQTCRAGTKVGTSDPAVACGSAVAQRIKGTPGITG